MSLTFQKNTPILFHLINYENQTTTKHFRPATFCFWKHYFIFIVWGISWLFALGLLLLGIGLCSKVCFIIKYFLDTALKNYILCLMMNSAGTFLRVWDGSH